MTQMLSMTSLTGPGGFCMDFTSEMSAGFRVSSAASAASSAGIASARSPSHSFCGEHGARGHAGESQGSGRGPSPPPTEGHHSGEAPRQDLRGPLGLQPGCLGHLRIHLVCGLSNIELLVVNKFPRDT